MDKMVKYKQAFLWIGIAIIVVIILNSQVGLFVITGSETMQRSATTQIEVGNTFDVTYTVQNVQGSWGVSILDEVISGDCSFPEGSELKTVMLSADGNTKTITVQAPNYETTCVFSGDYQFGTNPIENFGTTTVEVKSCNTNADTNCDGEVDRSELGNVIVKWINNQITRTELGEAIQAWAI